MHGFPVRAARNAACALALLLLAPASAMAKPVVADLRVEADEALSAGVSYVTDTARIPTDTSKGCDGSGKTVKIPGPTALGLLNSALPFNEDLRPLSVSDKFSFGLFVCGIGDFTGDDDSFWLYKVNHRAPEVGADQFELERGDQVLWYFQDLGSNLNTGDELVLFAPGRAKPGNDVKVTVYAYSFDGKRERAEGVTVASKDDTAKTDARGEARIDILREGRVFLRATRTGDIPSAPRRVCANADLSKCPKRFGERIIGTKRGDEIAGTRGADVVLARGGDDRVNVRGGGPDQVDCGKGRDRVRVDRRDTVDTSCERVIRR